MKLFGRTFTKLELLEHVGDVSQVCNAKKVVLAGGRQQGVNAVEVSTGSGLVFWIIVDRGMSIGDCFYNGAPLGWRSSTGEVSPVYYDPRGGNSDRSYFGGLVHLAGLRNIGGACEDEGEELGLHGRICSLPAENVSINAYWEDDEYFLEICGDVKETTALGEYVVLTRKVTTMLGANWFSIEDSVENRSFRPTEHTILYHTNYGFPLIEDGAEIHLNTKSNIDLPETISPMTGPGDRPWMFYCHDLVADSADTSAYVVCNRNVNGGLGLKLSYDKTNLQNLIHWHSYEPGHYVLELGPTNCMQAGGRKTEREQGTLCFLNPWEVRNYRLKFEILTNTKEIDEAIASLPK